MVPTRRRPPVFAEGGNRIALPLIERAKCLTGALLMNRIIYIVGLVVIVVAIVGFVL